MPNREGVQAGVAGNQPRPRWVTDAGLETDLIFRRGFDLPEFAAFPLVDDPRGREVLVGYYEDFARIAAAAGVGLLLETPTWRASRDWGVRIGYDEGALAAVNRAAVTLLRAIAKDWSDTLPAVRVSGQIGPKGDGYRPDLTVSIDEAAHYHRPQIQSLTDGGADACTALTLTTTNEALGIIAAARDVGLPVSVGFTVETDGTLPDGTRLSAAIERVAADDAPDGFLVNCAHPDHVLPAFDRPGEWATQIRGLRVNASTMSHAELDAATELDAGDPASLAASHARLAAHLPGLEVVGGCCGTDARHVAAIWEVPTAISEPS